MTARSRAARNLEALLGRKAGQRIDVQWNTDSGGSWRPGWGVQWMDGPTVEQVTAWAHELAGDDVALDVEQLHYYRGLSDRAWAVQLVRYVASGGSLEDPLSFRYELEDRMRAMSSPDSPVDEQEARRASALLRLADPHGENRMIDVLAAHGLAALDGEGELPAGVTPLRRPKRAEESL